MTIKLYDENAYLKEFDAVVTSCEQEKDLFKVTLDKTAFFPEEGGQTPDKGTLDGIEVLDVKIKGDEIFHYFKAPFKVGETYHGVIDFNHRYKNMQMHSGEHVFSGLVHKHFGYNNVGFHLSDNSATMDYDGKISFEEALALEEEANTVIYENKKISAYYPSKEELSLLEYRSKKELSGPVRIVTIEDTDICACCAPHVGATGEIGMLKIISLENYKGGVRINYLCGYRALKDYEKRIDDLREISRCLSAKAGEELSKVNKLNEELKDLRFDYISVKNELISLRIKEGFTGKEDGYIVLLPSESSFMKFAMESLKKVYKGISYVFCGDEENGYRYLIESDTKDLTPISENYKNQFNAKGGGRNGSIQGSVPASVNELITLI